MELLILGIDGGDSRIINQMDMPFTQKLIADRITVKINEDLWSRGWSEIASGLHGVDTGAFYAKPKLDGTYNFTQSYNYSDYKKNPECSLFWERLNAQGKRVGIVNMPTTIPAPQVDGFFIAGAGSGFSPSSRIPESACYPREMARDLLPLDCIWEQRFRVSGVSNFDVFIERCTTAIKQRTQLFISLNKKYNVDAGFIMHREFSTLTNLFTYLMRPLLNGKKATSRPLVRISNFYRVLDDFINVLVTETSPQHVMIVSDHSVSPYTHSMNLNEFLAKHGHLKVRATGLKARVRDSAREIWHQTKWKFNPQSFHGAKPLVWRNPTIDYKTSLAFSSNYVPGVYLNDERFGGPVNERQRSQLIDQIIDSFNGDPTSKAFKLSARRYREIYQNRLAGKMLPDIWVDLPETIFPEQRGKFIQRNPFFRSYEDLRLAHRDMITGIKGRNALCCVEQNFLGEIDPNTSNDLTVAYQLILNHFRH